MKEQRLGFATLSALHGKTHRCSDIDTGMLIFVLALLHKEAYANGDYIPAAREFQRQLIAFDLVHKWDYTLVFDGCPLKEKQCEHQRRCDKGGGVAINTIFIAMCMHICRLRFVKYIVSPAEADMQVDRHRGDGVACGGIPVCCDSDEVAYGNKVVVVVNDWAQEK